MKNFKKFISTQHGGNIELCICFLHKNVLKNQEGKKTEFNEEPVRGKLANITLFSLTEIKFSTPANIYMLKYNFINNILLCIIIKNKIINITFTYIYALYYFL